VGFSWFWAMDVDRVPCFVGVLYASLVVGVICARYEALLCVFCVFPAVSRVPFFMPLINEPSR
jgi:hypothetical protein